MERENHKNNRPSFYSSDKKCVVKKVFSLEKKTIEIEFSYCDSDLENKVYMFDTSRTRIAASTDDYDFQILQEAMGYEKAAITSIRTVQQDIIDLVRMKKREENRSKTEKSEDSGQRIFSNEYEVVSEVSENKTAKDKDGCKNSHHDYLSPFLLFVKDEKALTQDEAKSIRESYLKTMKERLMERANIIQNRLEEERNSLVTIQTEYQKKKRIGCSNEKEFEEVCSDKMFRIKILEKRLEEHSKRSFDKFKVRDQKSLCH